MNFDFQQPNVNDQGPTCSAATESNYEALGDLDLEDPLMQQALDDW